MNELSDFGPFDDVCRSGGYLSLLGMVSADAVAVVNRIAEIVRSTIDHPRYVSRLLQDRNWRGHLIALAAVLVSDEAAADRSSALWVCFDRGSWVAPQLAVSLLCCDPSFAAEAQRRIVARCPIVDDDDFFRGRTRDVSAKNFASLLQAVAYVPSETDWAASERRARDAQELLKADADAAGTIVERWFDAARARFRESGRHLCVAA